MKFSIKEFINNLSKSAGIWSHVLKKSLMGNFMFCAVLQHMHSKPISKLQYP